MNTFKIKGHSGCSLNIIEDDNGRLLVEKGCKPSYISRLQLQQQKQQTVYDNIKNGVYTNITTPHSTWQDDKIYMDYVHSRSFIEHFERCGVNDIKQLICYLIKYIDAEISLSPMKTVEKNVFLNKIDSIFNTCQKNELIDIRKVTKYFTLCKAKIMSHDNITIPIGVCHGDLTFSNILFTDSGMCLIDFLDSFIETPLQDVVKLRQDTLYNWSTLMTSQSYNETHVKMILDYIDDSIYNHFKTYDFYKYYDMLQYINILRILPYVKEEHIYNRVCEILDSIKL